jgi:hypothetical protein
VLQTPSTVNQKAHYQFELGTLRTPGDAMDHNDNNNNHNSHGQLLDVQAMHR